MLTIKFMPCNLDDITHVKIENFVFEKIEDIIKY